MHVSSCVSRVPDPFPCFPTPPNCRSARRFPRSIPGGCCRAAPPSPWGPSPSRTGSLPAEGAILPAQPGVSPVRRGQARPEAWVLRSRRPQACGFTGLGTEADGILSVSPLGGWGTWHGDPQLLAQLQDKKCFFPMTAWFSHMGRASKTLPSWLIFKRGAQRFTRGSGNNCLRANRRVTQEVR